MNIAGKVALITGASSGVGEAVAIALGSLGVKLTLVARREKRLTHIAKRVEQFGTEAFIYPADLKDIKNIPLIFQNSHEHWRQLDIVINNAAIGIDAPFFTNNQESAWQDMLELNILAPSIIMREALQYFNPLTGGYIVNTSSTSAHRVPPGGGFYAATKFAIRALSEVLRQELCVAGSKTRISCVSPGRIATNFFQDQDRPIPPNEDKSALDPEDVARSIIFLLQNPVHVSVQDVILRSNRQKT